MEKDEEMYEYYRLIGQLKRMISRCSSLTDAIRDGFRGITGSCGADLAIAWYLDRDGDGQLHPFYWIGNLDVTRGSCGLTDNLIGRTFAAGDEAGHGTFLPDYKRGQDPVVDALLADAEISSLICEPFSGKEETTGCLLFAKTDGSRFTPEQADVCGIFTDVLSLDLADAGESFRSRVWGEVLLQASRITKVFRNGEFTTEVLRGINLNIYAGEFVAILGESGCGKTTFLNILGGMNAPTDGLFTFLGRDYSHAGQDELTAYRRYNIGFIFQDYNLMPNLTAKQNLDLIGELVDRPMDSVEALELVGLRDRQNNYPSQLSGGQQQRVSIARALIKKPRIIFADEPTAALDYATSIEVLRALERVVRNGTTLVMVTHNEEITRMADRVVRLRGGRTYEVLINNRPAHADELVW